MKIIKIILLYCLLYPLYFIVGIIGILSLLIILSLHKLIDKLEDYNYWEIQMIIRMGFVSNSSSSSFLIKNKLSEKNILDIEKLLEGSSFYFLDKKSLFFTAGEHIHEIFTIMTNANETLAAYRLAKYLEKEKIRYEIFELGGELGRDSHEIKNTLKEDFFWYSDFYKLVNDNENAVCNNKLKDTIEDYFDNNIDEFITKVKNEEMNDFNIDDMLDLLVEKKIITEEERFLYKLWKM